MKTLIGLGLAIVATAAFGGAGTKYSEMAARYPVVDVTSATANQTVLTAEGPAEGAVWEAPKRAQWALTGNGRRFVTLPDGRLCVVFADTAEGSPTKGDLVAWIGHRENSQCLDSTDTFRMRLLQDHGAGADGCRSLKVGSDGTVVATTRLKYRAADRDSSLVAVRFRVPAKATASAEELYRARRARADEWYLPSRLGVFYHWGLFTGRVNGKFPYSTPADFEAAATDPEKIAANIVGMSKDMGAKYAVLTLWHTCACHMLLYPSKRPEFYNKTTKDYVGAYLRACRAAGLKGLLYFPTDSNGWNKDPAHPTMDAAVGESGSLAFAECVGHILEELKERYGDLVCGFWIDGGFPDLSCTIPSKIHSLWPHAIVIGNNHVRMTIPDVDICTTEVCPKGTTSPDYSRPDWLRFKNAFRMPPPPDDLNEDTPTLGSWEFLGEDKYDRKFETDTNRLVRLVAASLGQRGRWNCCIGFGPRIDGTAQEKLKPTIASLGRFLSWAGEAVYGTKGPAGTFFGAGPLYGYDFSGYCSVTQSLENPNVFYVFVTDATYKADNLAVFATNGHTPKRVTDLRTGREYSFATYQSTELSGVDWSDVKTYGATVLKFEF